MGACLLGEERRGRGLFRSDWKGGGVDSGRPAHFSNSSIKGRLIINNRDFVQEKLKNKQLRFSFLKLEQTNLFAAEIYEFY